jgi:RNA polymerase sigma-70 factor, ECF subfamily
MRRRPSTGTRGRLRGSVNVSKAGQEHDDPDVQLMLKVKAGDRTAFEELVHRHSSFLVNFMFKFTGSAATAEDLAQEAFFKVFRAASGYEPTARFKTWLLTIAANLCMNRKRWE